MKNKSKRYAHSYQTYKICSGKRSKRWEMGSDIAALLFYMHWTAWKITTKRKFKWNMKRSKKKKHIPGKWEEEENFLFYLHFNLLVQHPIICTERRTSIGREKNIPKTLFPLRSHSSAACTSYLENFCCSIEMERQREREKGRFVRVYVFV